MARRRPRLLPTLLAAFLLPGLLPSASAVAQWSPPELELTDAIYTSPTWGYAVRWHASEWTPATEESAGGTDVLELRTASGETARYEGTDRFGDDPAACRKAILDDLKQTPGVSDIEVVPNDQGGLIWSEQPGHAYGFYVYSFEQNGTAGDRLAYVDCQSLVPGQAVLAITHTGAADAFDLDHLQPQQVYPSRRSVFPFNAPDHPPFWSFPIDCDRTAAIEDSSVGVAGNDATPSPGAKEVRIRLHFYTLQGSAQAETHDASQYFLLDRNDFAYPLERFEWAVATGDPTAVQELPPGTSADLSLVFLIPENAEPSRLQEAALDPSRPTLAAPVGCLNQRNGDPVRPLEGFGEPQISFVMDRDGTELGMVTWVDSTAAGSEGGDVLLDFANTGQTPWKVDPRNVLIENRLNQADPLRPRPHVVTLEGDPATLADDAAVTGAIRLKPGEHATFRLTFDQGTIECSEAVYLANSEQFVPVGGGPCSQGAGARPILRTSG